ncbi:MAG: glutamyl-tRNA reductase [Proteobacteria bacterium]|nr:glutamyl-tRNA reductase [Pseudomonadota bacterium]
MKDLIYCIGANHRTANLELRETFFIDRDILQGILQDLCVRFNFAELLVLSTCNRFEIIVIPKMQIEQPHEFLIQVWIELQRQAKAENSKITAGDKLQNKTYCLAGDKAVQHLFRVASSLDSLIPGETQITGQFRDAVALASECDTLGTILSRLSQEALATAKKVRSQTNIGKNTVSISHSAVSLAKRMFQNLSECRFLIVGTGEMGRVAAEYAWSYNPKKLTIANRTIENANQVANQIASSNERISVIHIDDIQNSLREVDVVITATGSSNYIITEEMIKKLRKVESINTPLFLVDIAMPRNIDPNCSLFDDVYLFDIDDLKQVVDQNLEDRKIACAQAESFITDATEIFGQWLKTQKLAPLMEAWRDHVSSTLQRESQKTLSKELFVNLTNEQKKGLNAMLDSITSKLTSDLAQSLRTSPPEEALKLAQSIGQVFGLYKTR